MENLDLLRTLIKKHANTVSTEEKEDLHSTVMDAYARREPLTNTEKKCVGEIAWEMLNNYLPEDNDPIGVP